MSRHRRRGRRDANHADIVEALGYIPGMTVVDLGDVGGGCPDLLVGYNGRNWLFEVKTEKGRLNGAQVEFMRNWTGEAFPVRGVLEIIDIITGGAGLIPRHNEGCLAFNDLENVVDCDCQETAL